MNTQKRRSVLAAKARTASPQGLALARLALGIDGGLAAQEQGGSTPGDGEFCNPPRREPSRHPPPLP